MLLAPLYFFPVSEKTEAHTSRSSSGVGIQKVRGVGAEEQVRLRMKNSFITLGVWIVMKIIDSYCLGADSRGGGCP